MSKTLKPELSMVARKIGELGKTWELVEYRNFDENFECVDFYDGASVWYKVYSYIDGLPIGIKEFGPHMEKAYRYFKRVK